MAEPMQILVQKYLEEQGYFLRSNLKYKVPRNYSDVDLIGINKENKGIVVEVKAWAAQNVNWKDGKQLVDDFSNEYFVQKVNQTLGDTRETRKLLVLAWIGPRDLKTLQDYARTRGVEIMTLDEVINWFFERLDTGPNYENEALQLVRMLKVYGEYGKADFLRKITKPTH